MQAQVDGRSNRATNTILYMQSNHEWFTDWMNASVFLDT